jgi:NAD(P)-dependent dehydrogenase (short-subunit alcohol dehydrogenase family)
MPASPIQVFDWKLQHSFAVLSGDRNPVHMDAIAARRTQAGQPVVHGIHAVLWALETLAGEGKLKAPISQIKVRFLKLTYVGDAVTLDVIKEEVGAIRAILLADGVAVTSLQIAFGEPMALAINESAAITLPMPSWPEAPLDLSLMEIDEATGWLCFAQEAGAAADLFPMLTAAIGLRRVSALACMSRLVGMVCPGLHSIFSSLSISTADAAEELDAIHYQVKSLDQRFRLVKQSVDGGGWSGVIESFVRVPPVAQPSMEALAKVVGKDDFKNSNALIIGGSRGLGELTAKVIAAGGGSVTITYAVGQADALEVQRQIRDWGGRCEVLQYNAHRPAASQLRELKQPISSFYYFATSVFGRKSRLFSRALFVDFICVYVEGFHDVLQELAQLGNGTLAAFYPSSVAIVDRPPEMTEYAMAKAAAEILCADLARFTKGLHVVIERLPRMLTDLTATVMPVETASPLEVMLPIVRKVEASTSQ